MVLDRPLALPTRKGRFPVNISRHARCGAAILILSSGIGCSSEGRYATDQSMDRVGLTVEASNRDITVGEIVTLSARTSDTYGRDANIEWTSTSGKLTTERNGRVARVGFEQPGTYTVTSILSLDGRETRRQAIDIRVKPLS